MMYHGQNRDRWMIGVVALEARLACYLRACPATVERIVNEAWSGDCSRWAEEPEPRDDDHLRARPKRAAYAIARAWLAEVTR